MSETNLRVPLRPELCICFWRSLDVKKEKKYSVKHTQIW